MIPGSFSIIKHCLFQYRWHSWSPVFEQVLVLLGVCVWGGGGCLTGRFEPIREGCRKGGPFIYYITLFSSPFPFLSYSLFYLLSLVLRGLYTWCTVNLFRDCSYHHANLQTSSHSLDCSPFHHSLGCYKYLLASPLATPFSYMRGRYIPRMSAAVFEPMRIIPVNFLPKKSQNLKKL